TDGGRSWSKRLVFNRPNGIPFADKEWVGCDTTNSTNRNRIYLTWTDFNFNGNPILLKYSTNFGTSWSSNVRVSDGANCQGSCIAVGPSGQVYVAWSDSGRVGFDRSLNGGATFGTDRFPSSVVEIPSDPVFRRNSFPVMDADRSGGRYGGNI